MTRQDLSGQTLGGRYDLLELLGTGGMGAVYRARDRELDEIVALKVIRDDLARDPEMIERFRREVKLARRVTHTNVARTFELVRSGSLVFCTMELVEGEPLTQRLVRERRLPIAEAVAIACALCDGLTAAHAVHVIHRDIKPDNVLLANDGRVVMADFGVAAIGAGDLADTSGTPAYMAPEQARGEPPSPAVDVYAVGVLLLEMVTGRRAFQGGAAQILSDKQTLERVAPGIGDAPAELAEVIGRATARDLAARFATAAELRAALAPWSHGQRMHTAPPVAVERDELSTIVVLAPQGDADRVYLAEAVYDELLARLTKKPRLRVLPRAEAELRGATVVKLSAGETLSVVVERDGSMLVALDTPLSIGHVEAIVEALSETLMSKLALTPPRATLDPDLEAYDLMMRARHDVRRNLAASEKARDLIARAQELRPDDPRIAATRAMVDSRAAFFLDNVDDEALVRAAMNAHAAVAAAPELAEAHLALGHVELHSGNAVVAAGHYRTAIARAPYSSEAHEYLGRMLLEAGYLDRAIPRLEEARAIAPSRRAIGWELARAWALEGRWDDHDRVVEELKAAGSDRVFARARTASWRRDPELLKQFLDDVKRADRIFVKGLMPAMFAVFTGEPWPAQREKLLAIAGERPPNHRRRTFVAQLAAEAAGWAGDVETAGAIVEQAIGDGLFDLHWLERCPLLDQLRASPDFARIRAPIKRRAEAILDALYGDQDLGTSDTVAATT
jgi:tetratricopeptide (TPR) repeat protein